MVAVVEGTARPAVLLTKEVLRENYVWRGAGRSAERARLDGEWAQAQQDAGITWKHGWPRQRRARGPRLNKVPDLITEIAEEDLPLPPRCRSCRYYLHVIGHEVSCG